MFSSFRAPTELEMEIGRAIRELKNHPIGSKEYAETVDMIVKLHQMKEKEKVSKDTFVTAGANLMGILMIIGHEQIGHAITSRAMQLVFRLR